MPLKSIKLKDFTVFDNIGIEFIDGVNVFIGENATGKTHILKLLYAACQSAQSPKTGYDFPLKVARVFRPDDYSLMRLVKRKKGNHIAEIEITTAHSRLAMEFNSKQKNSVKVSGVDRWNKEFADLTSTYIPVEEILSHSKNLIQAITVGNVEFDDTYKDIIAAASIALDSGPESDRKKRYLQTLQSIMQGRVRIENEEFYMIPSGSSSAKLEFQLIAEGLRKIALLWQLIKNGTLEKGAILFWDEPEANVNPRNIPAIANLLMNLQQDGVQVFIATHDYFLAKYLSVFQAGKNDLMFHSLYKDKDGFIKHEMQQDFETLVNNSILQESVNLYEKEVNKILR